MQETYQAVIVEDDPMIASIDQNFLERDPRFHLAASFRSGQDALPWLLRHPADLLILDVYMPRMTGLELLRELRSFGVTSGVVMVTAANDSKTVDALLKLGVADYLVKPFTARRFQQALDKFCRQRSAIDNPQQRQPGGAGRPALRLLQSRGRPEGAPVPHSGADPDPSGPGPGGGLHL